MPPNTWVRGGILKLLRVCLLVALCVLVAPQLTVSRYAHGSGGTYARRNAGHSPSAHRLDIDFYGPEYPSTTVTALYDIDRATKGDGRSMREYVDWFKATLMFKGPLAVFVGTVEHAQLVRQQRQGLPTVIHVRPLERLHFFKLRKLVENIQKDEKWKTDTIYKGRMENILDMYPIMIFNKFAFMDEIARSNPFDSKYFWWMDAGLNRFWEEDLAITGARGPWPNMTRLQVLDPNSDKIFLKKDVENDTYYKPLQAPHEMYKFMCADGNGFLGGLFGGTAPAVHNLLQDVENFLFFEMLPMRAVANEQMFFYFWYTRNQSRVAVIPASGMSGWLEHMA